jgi:FG-GAP-like repeat
MYGKTALIVLVTVMFFGGCDDSADYSGGGFTGGSTNSVCEAGDSAGPVEAPQFVMNLTGQTGWYAAPLIYDLDGDGANELIAAYYDLFVFDLDGNLIARGEEGDGRVYAPHVLADIDQDGIVEIIVGRGGQVIAYEWRDSTLVLKDGFPADTVIDDSPPEIRGMSAGDLNGDGNIEIVVTTTETADEEDGGSQVYVFDHNGNIFQPIGGHSPAWPRYNSLDGQGNDAQRNGSGHHGYGCYGLNVGIGNIDDDPELEIFATYDNHHIQAFDYDGVAINAAPYFTNRDNDYSDERFTWGQFIRWADPVVEGNHYNEHTGDWPNPSWTEWLQWTASPPHVADIDNDGKNEVIGIPNIEMHIPYETQAYGLFVLDGNYGDGSKSAMRKDGWEILPRGEKPISFEGWYPPKGVPAAAIVNLHGDDSLEIIVSLNDGYMYCFNALGEKIWKYNYRHNRYIMFSSEPTIADLNQDGSPEIIFTTFGEPNRSDSGNLIILGADGSLLHDIPLPNPGNNGNGNGAPSAPTVGDLDGDGQLEIIVQTFDHSMDVFTVPGSTSLCLPWFTARGGNLRKGSPD